MRYDEQRETARTKKTLLNTVPTKDEELTEQVAKRALRVCGLCSCFKVLIRQYQHLVNACKYTKIDVNTLQAHIY